MSEEKSITEIVTWWGADLPADNRRGLIAELFRREQARLDRTAEQAGERVVLVAQADTVEHHLAEADRLLANAPVAGEQLTAIADRHAGAQWHLLRAQLLMLRAPAGVVRVELADRTAEPCEHQHPDSAGRPCAICIVDDLRPKREQP